MFVLFFVTIMPLFSFVIAMLIFINVYVFFYMLFLCKYMCCGIFIHVFLFTNLFVFLRLQKIAKKRKFVINAIYCAISHFGTN